MKRFFDFLLGAADDEVAVLPEVAELPVATKQSTQELIAEIHNSFRSVGDRLLAEAQATLNSTDAASIAKGERLRAAGFVNTRQVKQTQEQAKKAAEAAAQRDLIIRYSLVYPTTKFITREHVDQIAAKYNLVVGDTSAYLGFVPDKNLREIEEFNNRFHADDKPEAQIRVLKYKYWGVNDSENKRAQQLYPDGLISLADPRLSLGGSAGIMIGGSYAFIDEYERINSGAQLICAPPKDMDLSKLKQQNGHWFKTEKVHVPDPVVLQPVKGGYLCVTMWGEEASDPLLVNPMNN